MVQSSKSNDPLLYVVAFSSEDDWDTPYSPIVAGTELSADGATQVHLLSRQIIPALPALWYCLHLPKTIYDLVDIQLRFLPDLQAWAMGHNILLIPINAAEEVLEGPLRGLPRTLLIGPDSDREELNRLAKDLGFSMPVALYSDLSPASLQVHWKDLTDLRGGSFPRPPGPDIEPVTALRTAGIELPTRRLLRQLGHKSEPLPTDPKSMILHSWQIQAHLATFARLEAEGCSPMEAEGRIPDEMAKSVRQLRLPMTAGFPGVSPNHRRLYGAIHEDKIVDLNAASSSWPGRFRGTTDAESEYSATALLVAHQAIAEDSMGIMLPDCPAEAFTVLAELERHCARGARPKAVRSLLRRLNQAMAPVWEDPSAQAIMRASSLTVVGNFPIGLSSPPRISDPLSCLVPMSYRPLIPLTRMLPAGLLPHGSSKFSDGFHVLVAECIPVEDRIGPESRKAWSAIAENFSQGDSRVSIAFQETLSVQDLKDAITEHVPDVLVISAHGFSSPKGNSAGIMIGYEPSLGIGLGPLPPLVILSACHVAPRGTGAVTITDLLLREGALAVLGTLVPVDVLHNAMLVQRVFLYMTEVLAGREDHGSFREVWHRVQTSNAVHDVTSAPPAFLKWFMSRPDGGPSPHELFKNVRSAGRIRLGNVYSDTEDVLREIAEDLGDLDRVNGWIKGQGYVPESAFYCLVGNPERIYLQQSSRLAETKDSVPARI